MKRLLVMPLLLVSCKNVGDSPAAAASGFLTALQKFEIDKARSYLVEGEQLNVLNEVVGDSDMSAIRKAMWSRMTFTVESHEDPKGQEFVVLPLKIKTVDTTALVQQAVAQRNNGTLFFVDAINSPQASMREDFVPVLMHKTKNGWKVGTGPALEAALIGVPTR